jgi:hypothetical protein
MPGLADTTAPRGQAERAAAETQAAANAAAAAEAQQEVRAYVFNES